MNVPEAALVNIDRGSVSRALSMLPEDQRLAIVLMDLAGHHASEVAEMLGCPRNTVLSRVHRGHKRLASLLIEEERQPMSCSEDRIIAFLAGELSDEDERRFDGHLLHCEDCWRAVQADRTARFALEKLREPAPAGLQDRMALAVSLAAPDAAPDKAGCRPLALSVRQAMARPVVQLIIAASLFIALAAGTLAWLQAKGGPADPPQVAAVARP